MAGLPASLARAVWGLALLPAFATALATTGPAGDRRVLSVSAMTGLALVALFALARHHPACRPSVGLILALAVAARLAAVAGPLRFDDDLWRYLWDGAVTNAGVSPYRFAPQEVAELDPRWDPLAREPEEFAELERLAALPLAERLLPRINFPFYPTIYPPVSELAFALASRLAPGSEGSWRLLMALADCGVVVVLLRLLGRLGKPPFWAAAYALHPLPILEFGSAGHQDPLGILFLLAAALLLLAGRRGLGGACLAGAAGIKLFPLALLAPWGRRLGLSGSAAFACAAAAVTLPFALLGPARLAGLTAYASRWEFFSGPFALLRLATGGRDDLARLIAGLLLVAGLVALTSRSRVSASSAEDLGRGFLWLEGALVLAPVVDPWYVPWALAAGALRGSLAWPVFAVAVNLAYLPAPAEGHAWPLRAAAWVPFLILLAVELRGLCRMPRPAEALS